MANYRYREWLCAAALLLSGAMLPQGAVAGVRIGVSDWPGWVAWYIADRNGYFARHGAQVELLWFDRYTDSIKALVEGELDANSQSWDDTLPLLAAGEKLELILINDKSTGNDALIVNSAINNIEQLHGKRIALELNSPSHLLLDAALQQHGMTLAQVELVDMPAADAANALTKGLVEAAVSWNPWVEGALQAADNRVLFDSSQLPGLISDALIARSDRLTTSETRREFVGVLRAWFDTVAFIQQQPEAAARIMAEVTNVNLENYQALLPGTRFLNATENLHALTAETDSRSTHATTARLLDYFSRQGTITTPLDLHPAINQQLIRAAIRDTRQ